MRLWHLILGVFLAATCLAIAREEPGRVAVVVFITGLCEVALGTTALLILFRTFAGIGEARGAAGYVEAVAATVLVLVLASLAMNGVFWLGIRIMLKAVA
jgi:hypothetical protein